MNSEVKEILNIVEENKEKFKDVEYKKIMDNLMTINKNENNPYIFDEETLIHRTIIEIFKIFYIRSEGSKYKGDILKTKICFILSNIYPNFNYQKYNMYFIIRAIHHCCDFNFDSELDIIYNIEERQILKSYPYPHSYFQQHY